MSPNPNPKPPEKSEQNSFMAVMRKKELTQSKLTELSEKLVEVALAVSKTGKKGSLTLRMDIIPENGALHFEAIIKQVIPVTPDHLCIFYVDPETEQLTRNDPHQKELDLRSVEPAAGTAPAPEASQAKTA